MRETMYICYKSYYYTIIIIILLYKNFKLKFILLKVAFTHVLKFDNHIICVIYFQNLLPCTNNGRNWCHKIQYQYQSEVNSYISLIFLKAKGIKAVIELELS